MITWKNVSAPDFTGVAQIQQAGNQSIQDSIDSLQALANQRTKMNLQNEADLKRSNTFKLLEEVRTTSNMEDYEQMSLNSLLSSVGGNADEEAVYNALLKQDDEIFNNLSRENDLLADELALTGAQITNDANRYNLSRAKTKAAQEDKLFNLQEKDLTIDNAASTYGMDLYSNAPAITDREIQDIAKKKGESLGFSGVNLQKFINKTVDTTKDMRIVKEDESPFVQLASTTVDNSYQSTVNNAQQIKDRIYTENPITPVFDVYADISTTSQAISQAVDKYPEGWFFSKNVGTNLRKRIEEVADDFAKDNKIDSVPPQILAAALKPGEGITTNEEWIGNDKGNIEELYRSIQKYYDMYQVNEVRKKNRKSADDNFRKTVGIASGKKEQGMLDILNSKGNIDDLTKMIKTYQ